MNKIENHRARLYFKGKGEYRYADIYHDEAGVAYAATGTKSNPSFIKLYKSKATSSKSVLVDKVEATSGQLMVKPDQLGRYTFVGAKELA